MCAVASLWQVSNLVFKYEHADVVCSVAMESLTDCSASPDNWKPQFQQPNGPRKSINKVQCCACPVLTADSSLCYCCMYAFSTTRCATFVG